MKDPARLSATVAHGDAAERFALVAVAQTGVALSGYALPTGYAES